jgi:hypothetical protein
VSGFLGEVKSGGFLGIQPEGSSGRWSIEDVKERRYGFLPLVIGSLSGTEITNTYVSSGRTYRYHQFNATDTINLGYVNYDEEISYLIIGGGGSGAGGAGGYVEGTTSGLGSDPYDVVVGAGGGGTGGYSEIFSIRGLGGGGGGQTGGSGGGAGGNDIVGAFPYGKDATQPTSEWGGYGNRGGNGAQSNGNNISLRPGGGGGGAGGAGGNARGQYNGNQDVPGPGGSGRASSITGSSVTRAGGGGGTSPYGPNASGGSGGGGNGGGGNGWTNTGSGGGQGGGQGGSGVVIIAYPLTAAV